MCHGYRETNRQLAKENGEIRQLLGEVIKENTTRREEIHRCHVRIIELEIIEKKYNALRQKFNSIVKIIESPEETLSITARSNSPEQQSTVLPITQATDIAENEDTQITTPTHRLDAISEHGEEEEEEADHDDTLTQTNPGQQTASKAESPKQEAQKTYSLYDSLEPADVTSMPCLDQNGPAPEQATLSIWKCLDVTTTPNSEKDKDMFQSTPKKPVLANADSRVNMSPFMKDPEHDKIVSFDQQQQQKQAQQSLQEVEEKEEEREVKKTKRKIKQKVEDAKRPRTYNLRKRN